MSQEHVHIQEDKALLKAAQAVWAANKYFVLACSQNAYNEVRRLLREEHRDLRAAYDVLADIDNTYESVPTSELPELTNALYHIAGYFKKTLPQDEREHLTYLVEHKQAEAVDALEQLTKTHNVTYLLTQRFFPQLRDRPFNVILQPFKAEGKRYEPATLVWKADHITSYKDESEQQINICLE